MLVKDVIDVDFINYKDPSMIIAMPRCTFKCDICNGQQVCQNSELAKQPDIIIDTNKLIKRYLKSSAKAICFQGLEPLDTFEELLQFIDILRNKYHCNDTIVIYTGYNKDEVLDKLELLKKFDNIIVKFGRFLLNRPSKYDELLGVTLASDNQYAEKLS